jgi:hypothetical protein
MSRARDQFRRRFGAALLDSGIPAGFQRIYSSRKISTGLVVSARQAGPRHAARATSSNTPGAAVNATTSCGAVPNSGADRRRELTDAVTRPSSNPATVNPSPWRSTRRSRDPRVAPERTAAVRRARSRIRGVPPCVRTACRETRGRMPVSRASLPPLPSYVGRSRSPPESTTPGQGSPGKKGKVDGASTSRTSNESFPLGDDDCSGKDRMILYWAPIVSRLSAPSRSCDHGA